VHGALCRLVTILLNKAFGKVGWIGVIGCLFPFGIFAGQEGFHAFHDGKLAAEEDNCLLSWKA